MLGGGSVRRRRGQRTIAGRGEVERADWVDATTGERPALLGPNPMDDTPSRVERGMTSNAVEQAIAWHQAGGMVQVQWQGNAPAGLIDEPDDEWYRGFSTEATTFDVAEAMADPESEGFHLLVRDLDAIASQPPRLRDAGTLVLWRPLHEAQGGWVWWGARGAGPLQKLWALTWDRLVNVHGPHDLIRVRTSRDSPEALGWCPGDDRVDGVGADVFPATGTYPTSLGVCGRLVDLHGGRKMVAMSENGASPDPVTTFERGADWLWFMARGMVEDADLDPPDLGTALDTHPRVVTHADLPRPGGAAPTPAATPSG